VKFKAQCDLKHDDNKQVCWGLPLQSSSKNRAGVLQMQQKTDCSHEGMTQQKSTKKGQKPNARQAGRATEHGKRTVEPE